MVEDSKIDVFVTDKKEEYKNEALLTFKKYAEKRDIEAKEKKKKHM
jgi:hypothetical protein